MEPPTRDNVYIKVTLLRASMRSNLRTSMRLNTDHLSLSWTTDSWTFDVASPTEFVTEHRMI
jgi:hypothetical protein